MSKWIPVTERLPDKDGEYLCTYMGYTHNYIATCSFTNDLYKINKFDFAEYKGKRKHGGFYFYNSEYGYCEAEDVIAWMTLPKPYEFEDTITSLWG